MNSLILDVRQAVRGLRRAPGSAFIAVIALGLGIGLTTLMFSIIYGALMRGLPVENPDELVAIQGMHRLRSDPMPVSAHDFVDLRADQRSFEDLGGYWGGTVNVSGNDENETAERFSGLWLTPSILRMLGVQPVLGRSLQDADDVPGSPPVAVISHEMWQRRFHGESDVVGRTMRANGVETEIVGVMPPGFAFPAVHQLWQPARLDASRSARGEGRAVTVFARLRDGVSADAAALELNRIADRIAAEFPETNRDIGVRVIPFTETAIGDGPKAVLLTMLGAVAFVLLIACTNVANLLIGRAIMRSREVGIRTSLGAPKLNVALPFLAESAVLALAGAVLGAALAWVGIELFSNAVADTQPPYWLVFRLDGAALVCIVVLTTVAAVLAGVFPAVQAARMPIGETLKDESRGASSFRLGRLSRVLVVVEMALSVGLLAGAGLMIKSVIRVNTIELGFPAEQIFTARLGLPESSYPDVDAIRRFHDALYARLQSVPGVRQIHLAEGLPGLGAGRARFTIEGLPVVQGELPAATQAWISPGYFDGFDASPSTGRVFGPQDRAGSMPVAIVNAAFARRWFPEGDALGRRVRIGAEDAQQPWRTIVGIAPDLRAGGTDSDALHEAIYIPLAQEPLRFVTIVARTDGPPLGLTADVRAAVRSIDPDIPLYFVRTLAQGIAENNWFYGVFGSLFAAFGLAALFLAGVGLYGVMSFSVGQRTRELGVRMAIGAQPADVMRMVLTQGMRQVAIGMLAGTLFALAVSSLIASILFEVSPRDPAVFAITSFVLIACALLACGLPALRATRVDPLHALRAD